VGTIRYYDVLDDKLGVVLYAYFHSQGPDVTDYSLVLLSVTSFGVETVRVYDSTHGVNEMHRYTRDGGKQNGVVFSGATLGEGMRAAMRQIKKGYLPMIEGWER
jgi:hypothetical protein